MVCGGDETHVLVPDGPGPDAVGQVGWTPAGETVGDLGTGMALVYWPDRRDDAAQVTFAINMIAGTFWCILTILLAPFIADFFNTPQGTNIVRALALAFPLKYLGNTHDALARKDLRFRARAVPELSLAILKAAIAIVLAWQGFGAWSLVWGHLGGLLCWTAFLWIMVPWRPSFALPRDLVAPMLRYGRGIIAVNIIASILHHVDLVIVGRFLGLTALGGGLDVAGGRPGPEAPQAVRCREIFEQTTRTRRWAMMAMTLDATRNGGTPRSIRRVIEPGASFVCSVLKTRCPVKEA